MSTCKPWPPVRVRSGCGPPCAWRRTTRWLALDLRYPDGADYVIVPALSTPDDPVLLPWLAAQAAKGATIVSICDGALVAARAGVFKGHRATGHWATHKLRVENFPDTEWLANRRYVADGKVVSSA
ncbi:DJ-1/PfpI family protein [Massilia sp. B-10]|nr:DJ-1/PfpI family protein [Massilia sp. B-10]